jgi:hypothetical protein
MEFNSKNVCDLSELILKEEDEILVPANKLLHLLLQEQEAWQMELEQLQEFLKADSRFTFYGFPEESELWPDELNKKMAEQGLFKGDKIMLVERKPSPDDLKQMILGNLDYLYQNLSERGANPLEESEMLQYQTSMDRVKELYEHFQDLVIDDEKQDD